MSKSHPHFMRVFLLFLYISKSSVLAAATAQQNRPVINWNSSSNNIPQTLWTVVALIHVSHTLEQRMFSHITGAKLELSGIPRQQFSFLVVDLWCCTIPKPAAQSYQRWCPPRLLYLTMRHAGQACRKENQREARQLYLHCLLYNSTPSGWGLRVCFYICLFFLFMEYKYYMTIQN